MSIFDDIFGQVPDEPIYHYTSQQGMLGILKKKAIWASEVHYLNDSEEYGYAFNLLRRQLREGQYEPEFINTIEKTVTFYENIKVYVASFSGKGDLLSQWRAYCPDAGGFSIGFSYSDLESALQKQRFTLVSCVYDEKRQKNILNKLIKEALNRSGTYNPIQFRGFFAGTFIKISTVFKHPSFIDEKEWRMVSTPYIGYDEDNEERIYYREGKSMLIPYVECELADNDQDLSFKKIIVGPTPHPELSKESIVGLVRKYSKRPIHMKKVQLSTTPYRTW